MIFITNAGGYCPIHRSQATPTTTTLPPPGSDQTSAEHPDVPHNLPNSLLIHTNEPSTEEPLVDPPANVGEEGSNEQSTEEPPGDPLTNVEEEGNISGPSHPVRTPYLSENIAECIGYTKEGYVPITFHLDAI